MTKVNGDRVAGHPLLDIFNLDQIADAAWRARTIDPRGGRLFGGTTLAQTLAAARLSVSGERRTTSLHVQFFRPADGGVPCELHVENIYDGKSSAVRSVTMTQHGRPVATGTVTFRTPRETWSHGNRGESPVSPETLPRTGTPHPARAIPPDIFDIRYYDQREDGVFVRRLWFRTVDALPVSAIVHECVVSFISDLYFFEPVVAEHGFQGNDRTIRYGTTEHSMWFHEKPRADEWLLIESRSPVGAGGRGLVSGEIRTSSGLVVATVVQEVAVRITP